MCDRCTGGPSRPVSRRAVLRFAAAAPAVVGLAGAAPLLIGTPHAPAQPPLSVDTATATPPIPVISRGQWGADESLRRAAPVYDNAIRAGIIHHSATGNNYAPNESAAIVRSIYAYHTRSMGWADIAYNALVDKHGQVFEGRFGGLDKPVEGSHTGGFNKDTWAVCLIGDYGREVPTPAQLRSVGRLLGWRLALGAVDPRGAVTLTSAGGPYTRFRQGMSRMLPSIFAHRDVGDTACPGNAAYAFLDRIREIAARFNQPPTAEDVEESMRGGAIITRWQALGGASGALGPVRSPEAPGAGPARYVIFTHGAIYWSPATGAQPLTGAIYDAWATLGYERSSLGLPTSGQIQEPQWIVQNFQHGTLNIDRENGAVTMVADGQPRVLPSPPPGGPPVQLERFSPARNRIP